MELIRSETMAAFSRAGVTSRQLLFPENSRSERVTVTRVVLEPGAQNRPHRHPASEQIWIALRGRGELLLEHGERRPFAEGDVVRFEDGELHGLDNTGASAFEYVSVTSPPLNFRAAYARP
jgi:quercetin dioxygenase-like cupin family protein